MKTDIKVNGQHELRATGFSSHVQAQGDGLRKTTSRHRNPVKIICAAFLTMMLASLGHATVFYVDVVIGSDSNSGTSQATAWAHLPGTVGVSGAGWVVLQNGDIIYVKGGTTNNVKVKFTSSFYNGSAVYDSIRVISGHLAGTPWGSGRAIFDGQNTRTYGLWVGNGHGLTLDGLEVRNIAGGAVGTGFDPSVGSCLIAMGGAETISYNRITRCYLHHAIRTVTDTGHGIETDGSSGSSHLIIEKNVIGPNIGTKGIEVQTYDYGIIRNNFITKTGDHGIVITGNRWDICNNAVYMIPPYAHEPVFGIKVNNFYNDVWNNLVYQGVQLTGNVTTALQGIGTLNNASNNRFYFNTCINCSDLNWNRTGAGLSIADENATGSNNDFQNNIAAFCTNNIGGNWSTVQLYIGTGASSCTIKFCNFWSGGAGVKVIARNTGSGYTWYTSAEAVGASPGGNLCQNLSQVDPAFTGGSLPDGLDGSFQPNTSYFRLSASTPAAITTTGNSGLSADSIHGYDSSPSKFATDILGVTRSNWSMGAYEYAGTDTPPDPPLGLRVAGD